MAKYYHMPPQGNGTGQGPQQPGNNGIPSLGKMIAKVAIGAIFIVMGLEDVFSDFSFFLVSLIIGAALIAWGLIPYFEAKRRQQAEETEKILSAKVPGFEEEDEAEKLAKKYTDR